MKLLVTKNGTKQVPFTQEELDQREQDRLVQEEQKKLDKLKPSKADIEKAERMINLIDDLIELGVI